MNVGDRDGIRLERQANYVIVGSAVEIKTGGCLWVNDNELLLKITGFCVSLRLVYIKNMEMCNFR
jgi:hypothetical protein